ncbi:unnamed protein product [Caenorhabditis sp. 36 PRJEB53466]|nr:unnamed protein product [Caenorhabditis sp. 36 PRJEB53466]
MLDTAFRRMLKWIQKKPATSPQQTVDISRPTNLVVSKHKLVRTDGDFILIMEGEKVIGLLDKRDLDMVVVQPNRAGGAPPQFPAPPPPSSISPPPIPTPPALNPYLMPSGSRNSESASLTSPLGITSGKYRTLPPGFASKQQFTTPHFQWNMSEGAEPLHFKAASIGDLFSPIITSSTNKDRPRAETGLHPQGSHKYETVFFPPIVTNSNSASARCNVEIHLGDERCPPPPNRTPPMPLTMSPCRSVTAFFAEELDFTEVQSVSVHDPDLAAMSMEELRKHAEEFDSFIEDQIQQKWSKEKAETERWIQEIAGNVAKKETIDTIRGAIGKKRRPSIYEIFQPRLESPLSPDPTDPEPNNDYEKLYVSKQDASVKIQSTHDSDCEIEDIRF